MKRVVTVVGTRPDAIKMAPVILELKKERDLETLVVASGQHKEMLRQVLDTFQIREDFNFDVMRPQQSLSYITSSVLNAMDEVLEQQSPDMVVAQGDTTTTFVASLGAFYRRIPFAHVEAGLRTPTVDSPFPEEFNRRATGIITQLHFPPTLGAAKNLVKEGVNRNQITVAGNTSIDAILDVSKRYEPMKKYAPGTMILVTTHRRENWGEPQERICRAILKVLEKFPEAHVVLPMHKNETVRETLRKQLDGNSRVFLIEPPEYAEFSRMMAASDLILTDSGGVQEEAPSLGKPVLVLRTETERPEGIESGNAILVGTAESSIFNACNELLSSRDKYDQMALKNNPYGDGLAAKRIAMRIRECLGLPFEKISEFQG